MDPGGGPPSIVGVEDGGGGRDCGGWPFEGVGGGGMDVG